MKFILKTTIESSSKEIYKTWLSSEGHTNMTGGKATISDKIGENFTAWDGYITGKNISLELNHKIKQTWRSSQFEKSEEDSILEIILNETNGETELTLIHSRIPENGEHYKKGWDEHYFQPMKLYFSKNNKNNKLMTSVNTYLTFNGNCEKAFNFYKTAFGGDFEFIGRFKDVPKNDTNWAVDETDNEKIMHISLPIGNTVLMGSDANREEKSTLKEGNNFSISINTDSKKEADRLFKTLSKNGQILMPMNITFWNSYFGMFIDQFGIQWMVSFDENENK